MALLIHTMQGNADLWKQHFERAMPEGDMRAYPDMGKPEEIEFLAIWGDAPKALKACTNLKAIFTLSAGVEHVLEDKLLGDFLVPIYRLEDAGMAIQMTEYALYAALTLQRDFDRNRQEVFQGGWPSFAYRSASSFRIGVMGAGVLGQRVARALQSHGYSLSIWRRSDQKVEGIESFSGPLAPFLQSLDLVVALLPHTPETTGLVNQETLAFFPENAGFVNLGRGSLVEEEALLNHLNAGKLRYAFLDVFQREPLPLDHPFRTHPRVTVTPHSAAVTLAEPASLQIAGKIALLKKGEVPSGLVDRSRKY